MSLSNFAGGLAWVIAFSLVLFYLSILILRWLWNITLPELFRFPTITFWQSFRLMLISGFLFSGGLFHFADYYHPQNSSPSDTRLSQVNDILLEAERTERAADAHLRESLRLLAILQPAIPGGTAPAP